MDDDDDLDVESLNDDDYNQQPGTLRDPQDDPMMMGNSILRAARADVANTDYA